jgi:phosphoglycerate dehydrogenase-like enzyme
MNVLANLPAGFFSSPVLADTWRDLESFASVRRASCDTMQQLEPLLEDIDAVLMWSWPRWSAPVLQAHPRLKMFAHIDLTQETARVLFTHHREVSIGRRGFSPAVSEMALLLMLSALRKTPWHQAAMRAGTESWVQKYPDDIDADERQMAGRRVGIVGFGGVGRGLATLLAPFNCDLAIHDPFLPAEVAASAGVENLSVRELCARSEVLVLCASANEGSKAILGREEIAMLPPRAVLVNVARAALVDTAALQERLERGDLYAALDVFDVEPLAADSPLRTLPNTLLSPHRAGGIGESNRRIVQCLVDDLRAWKSGVARSHPLVPEMIETLDA